MSLNETYSYIDVNQDRFVEDLRRFVRIPSISTQKGGTRKCAELLVEMMREIGIGARIIETEWQPYVFGEVKSQVSNKTLLIYNHYDVVSPDPTEAWTCDPFAAELREGKIIGRGATDSKGNLMAHLKAVEAFFEASGDVPINLKFIFDGEEEIGCVSMPGFIETYKPLLMADAVLSFDSGFTDGEAPTITFGNGGILYLEFIARGSEKILHSSRAGHLVKNPIWELVWALSTLKDPSERVLIDGFYDNIRAITEEDENLMKEVPWDDQKQYKTFGVKDFLKGLKGVDALRTMFFEPKCTICGFNAGYSGRGVKTVLPNIASAKVHFSLTADQLPNEILDKLKTHLLKHGYGSIELTELTATEPSVCSTQSEIAEATKGAVEPVYGAKPLVLPRLYGYGRQSTWIANRLGIEGVMTGIGPPDFNGHAPNEFMTVEHFIKGIKFAATIWQVYSRI
ncbi:MAG: M20/M25/M40 family metallo-hydrolase [Candidatus Hodarchaeota archaeon]